MGLKLLAILSMTVDHVNAVLFDRASYAATLLGRLAMPAFAYLLVYNLLRRTSSAKRYLLRLWAFALISQIPFSLAFPEIHHLNVFFTLAVGGTAVWLIETERPEAAAAISILALFCDYGFAGHALILAIYAWLRFGWSRYTGALLLLSLALLNEPVYLLYVPFAWLMLRHAGRVEASVPYRPASKPLFYWFYPAHLLALAGISAVL